MVVLPRLLVNPHSMIAFNRFNQLGHSCSAQKIQGTCGTQFWPWEGLPSDFSSWRWSGLHVPVVSLAQGHHEGFSSTSYYTCTCRFTRVLFGLSLSPFLLNAMIRYHLKQYESSSPTSLDSIYIDCHKRHRMMAEEALQGWFYQIIRRHLKQLKCLWSLVSKMQQFKNT